MSSEDPKITTDAAYAKQNASDVRHIVSAGLLVSGLGLVTKILGMVREIASAAIFGATRVMDSFQVANSVTQMFATWIEQPVRAVIVPYFTKILHEKGEAEAWRAASNILNTIAVCVTLVATLLFFGSNLVVRIFATGFHDRPDAWDQSARLVQILSLSLVLAIMATILGSLQNIYRRQLFPALGRIANGLFTLFGVIVLGRHFGIEGYALGILAGAFAMLVIQLGIIWRFRHFYRLTLRPHAPEVRHFFALTIPLFIGLAGTRLDVLIDRNFLSYLPDGHLALLMYALVPSAVVTDLIVMASGSVLFPHLAHLAAQKRFADLRHRLSQALLGYSILILPVTAFLCVASKPVVEFLYMRGKFSPEAAALTAIVLPILALSAPFVGVNLMLTQVFIAKGDTRTPVLVGFYRIGVKVALSFALFYPLGVVGLAIATSVSAGFRGLFLWLKMPNELRPDWRALMRDEARLLLAAVVSGGAAFGLTRLIPTLPYGIVGEGARLAVIGGGCLVLFLILCWLQRIGMLRVVLRKVLQRD